VPLPERPKSSRPSHHSTSLSFPFNWQNYKLCVSYPKMFVVPSSIKDDDLINTAPLHHKGIDSTLLCLSLSLVKLALTRVVAAA
jgi:hypothetical protein